VAATEFRAASTRLMAAMTPTTTQPFTSTPMRPGLDAFDAAASFVGAFCALDTISGADFVGTLRGLGADRCRHLISRRPDPLRETDGAAGISSA